MNKDAIFAEVKTLVDRFCPVAKQQTCGKCLYWTYFGMRVLVRLGLKPVFQAGNMSWPFVDLKTDDGKIDTHWSYIWSPLTPQSMLSMSRGDLPEMHSWIGLVKTQEIVDFSTSGFVEACERGGYKWTGPKPPQYLWGKPPEGVVYEPLREATEFAFNLIRNDPVTF